MSSTWVYDMETLVNRTLFCAKNIDTGEYFDIWLHEPNAASRLHRFMLQDDATFIGFNVLSFDNVVLAAFCKGRSSADIKRIADDLIGNGLSPWKAYTKYQLAEIKFDCIDLIAVAPSQVGLKAYGARMHMPVLQDMPMRHDEPLPEGAEDQLLFYCHNDCDTTEELLKRLESEILLRIEMSKRYNVDMRSKSDSQMAEKAYVVSLGISDYCKNKIPSEVKYTPPSYLRFSDRTLQELLEKTASHVFSLSEHGHVVLPEFLGDTQIVFGTGSYQLGVGGIHSTHDVKVCHVAGDSIIADIDGASFYPSIILECGFGPAHLGDSFVKEYRSIYTMRLAAKKAGDKVTDGTLKISLNGTFGKLASMYSVLYSPDLMLAVTLTGQFTLLMLIERLEEVGVVTLSANTDGIAVRYEKYQEADVKRVVEEFQVVSGLLFEYTYYRVLAMANVNNYFAVKTDRSIKEKGIYSPLSLKKNPTAGVCANAVGQWLANGVPFLETIRNAPFLDFLSARNVTGGGQQDGVYLGKVVRWYQSNDRALEPLKYVKNGNKVPKTDGARACMLIKHEVIHPSDLDYEWYEKEAIKIAIAVGCEGYLSNEQIDKVVTKKKTRVKDGKRK